MSHSRWSASRSHVPARVKTPRCCAVSREPALIPGNLQMAANRGSFGRERRSPHPTGKKSIEHRADVRGREVNDPADRSATRRYYSRSHEPCVERNLDANASASCCPSGEPSQRPLWAKGGCRRVVYFAPFSAAVGPTRSSLTVQICVIALVSDLSRCRA